MMEFSTKLKGNYFVSLDTLCARLRAMSQGLHQWMVLPVQGIFRDPEGERRSCVLIGYSNPDGSTVPNHICYMFSAVALAGHPSSDPEIIVQLDPGWMPSLSRGLYLEEGLVKTDFVGDFIAFWNPLKRCLGLLEESDPAVDPGWKRGSDHNNEELAIQEACKAALHSHLVWLSQCTDRIQEEVSEDTDPLDFYDKLVEMLRREKKREE
jgi:hypothetical protein